MYIVARAFVSGTDYMLIFAVMICWGLTFRVFVLASLAGSKAVNLGLGGVRLRYICLAFHAPTGLDKAVTDYKVKNFAIG